MNNRTSSFFVRWGVDTLQFGPPLVAGVFDLEALYERLAPVQFKVS